MLRNPLSNIYANTKTFWGPSIIDGRLNPARLALATRCYWIQSRILHIPDRFGFISAGPPRLQIEEICMFVVVVFFIGEMVFHGSISVFLVAQLGDDRPVKSYAALLCLVTMAAVGAIWCLLCMSSHRVEGYVWEDWKVHMD